MTNKNPQYLLSETIVDTVAMYMILTRLITPFEKWDACKLGIIDKNGKKLKSPVSAKEREAWDILTVFVWNFKKLLQKFLGKSKFMTYVSAAFLLKDSIGPYYFQKNQERLHEELSNFTFRKQSHIYSIIKQVPPNADKITEDNFEMKMFRYQAIFEALDRENKIDENLLIG